jgi:hypothetical protein
VKRGAVEAGAGEAERTGSSHPAPTALGTTGPDGFRCRGVARQGQSERGEHDQRATAR